MSKSILHKLLAPIGHPIKQYFVDKQNEKQQIKDFTQFKEFLSSSKGEKRIFYLGITNHKNLGDFAQYYCICRWIETYCKDYRVGKFLSDTVVNPKLGFVKLLSDNYTKNDVIVFQSGYTTQDLGGNHELMHRMIADAMPYANILMMPQTIFFQREENRQRTSESYNKCKKMLFFARDKVSFSQAEQMFPDLKVKVYPDIVTSLIGTLKFDNKREQIFLCRRNDGEKYYKEEDLLNLKERLSMIAPVFIGDTQSNLSVEQIRKNLKSVIEGEIEKYSRYKVTITDRYHGTIFSLVAGTPVIIIKSNDHKVVTGADWFNGIYDDYVYVANDLDDAYELAERICNSKLENNLKPYFEENYYGNTLRTLMDNLLYI